VLRLKLYVILTCSVVTYAVPRLMMGSIGFFIATTSCRSRMKSFYAILLVLVLIATLFPDVSEAMPKRGRGRGNSRRLRSRKGRTGTGLEAPPAPEGGEGGEDGEEEEVPAWCDPTKNLGGFLNFATLSKWCADAGYGPDFSPYRGLPIAAEEEGGEAGDEAAAAAEGH